MTDVNIHDISEPLPVISDVTMALFDKHHFPPRNRVVWSFVNLPFMKRTKSNLEVIIRKFHDINSDNSIPTYLNSYRSLFTEMNIDMPMYDIKDSRKTLEVIE